MRVNEFRQCAGGNAGQRLCQVVAQEMCTSRAGKLGAYVFAGAIVNMQKILSGDEPKTGA